MTPKHFNFSYDSTYDDLFVYDRSTKSAGSICMGDIVIDLDDFGKIVGMELINARLVLERLTGEHDSNILTLLSHLKECSIEIKQINKLSFVTLHLKSSTQEISSTVQLTEETLLGLPA